MKRGLKYANTHCNKRKLAAVSRENEAIILNFRCSKESFRCSEWALDSRQFADFTTARYNFTIVSRLWITRICRHSLHREISSLQRVASGSPYFSNFQKNIYIYFFFLGTSLQQIGTTFFVMLCCSSLLCSCFVCSVVLCPCLLCSSALL